MTWVDQNWEHFSPYLFYYNNTLFASERERIPEKIRQHYFGDRKIGIDENSRKILTQATGEAAVVIHSEKSVRLQAKANRSPVYFYYYTYEASQSFSFHLSNSTKYLGLLELFFQIIS